MRRKIAAGNWKMHGTGNSLDELAALAAAHPAPECDVLLCVPATLIARAAAAATGLPFAIGGQDCHANASGAHTGDISAEMLAEAGASHVILGHSERRSDHGETDADVRAKVLAARRAALIPLVCVGETLAQREADETESVLAAQLTGSLPEDITGLVIAYEPVWAIGTGLTATPEQIAGTHGFIRAHLARSHGEQAANNASILYGGSVKASNAAGIFAAADVDGALVGGASLKSADFSPIVAALAAT